MKFDSDYPEILVDLAQRTSQHLVASGMPLSAADAAARELAEQMREHWGGQLIYVGIGRFFKITQRDHEIWNAFTGRNHSDLARTHQISVAHIYRIVDRMRHFHQSRNQIPLFPAVETKGGSQ